MSQNLLPDALGDCARELRSRIRQHDDELVAAVTSHGIRVTYRRKDHCRHFHQNVGTDEVPVLVVNAFEVVEIEKQCCDTRSVTPRAPDLVEQKLSQVTRVVQLREIVCL